MTKTSKGTRKNRKHKPGIPTKFEPGFVARLDGRTEIYKALRERFDDLADDLGGVADLSGIKRSLLERFVWLEVTLTTIEAGMATADDVKSMGDILPRWIQATNSLLGIGKVLGLERQMKPMDLKTYTASKGNGEEQ